MKRSELKLTGETYRLTPDSWGETSIMIDEDAAAQATADAFGIDVEECDPDGGPDGRLESVDIATGPDGKFYAILHPYEEVSWGHKTGVIANENLYRECENPIDATFGTVALYGRWTLFDRRRCPMVTVKKWVNGAKTFVEEPETSGPTMTDLYDIVARLERKVDMLGRQAGAYTTMEGVTQAEKDSLKGGGE